MNPAELERRLRRLEATMPRVMSAPTDEELQRVLRDSSATPEHLAYVFDIVKDDLYAATVIRAIQLSVHLDDGGTMPDIAPCDTLFVIASFPADDEVPRHYIDDRYKYARYDRAKWESHPGRASERRFVRWRSFVMWAHTDLRWRLVPDPEALELRQTIDTIFETGQLPATVGLCPAPRATALGKALDGYFDPPLILRPTYRAQEPQDLEQA